MWIKILLLAISFLGFGLLSSGGVFTVFVTVGLVPRFADKTHTAKYIIAYENSIVAGAIVGCILSVFPDFFEMMIGKYSLINVKGWEYISNYILSLFGIFAGMFVGCFAIAIAEMLNTIPIFTRRVRLGKGTGIVLLCLALGKTVGALLYFYYRIGY
ncbi:MAG: stage V sporulation protein AB [Lachnospiraceae bacterium]|nr:stage V sporulation protein AB [Lachnospiraceae bacterium]